MGKLLSYEELQNRISKLETELSNLRSDCSGIPFNINPCLFFEICEHSKNAIALFESQDDGNNFIIKYLNKKAEEFELVDRNKIIGKNIMDIFPSIKNSGFLDALKRVFSSNQTEEFPAVAFSSGKIIEWKQNYIYKLSDKEIVSIYIDETTHKTKEYELKDYQEKLQMAMEAANYFSFEINLSDFKIATLNELYLSLGYSKGEIKDLLLNTGSLIHPEDFKLAKSVITEHIRGIKSPLELEFRVKDKQKKWVWFKATGRVIEWEKEKNPPKLIGLVRNIQAEKEMWFKLKESQEKFKSLATLLPEVVYETDINGNLTFVNLKAFEIFEYNQEDFDQGLNIMQMLAPEEIKRARKNIKILFDKGNSEGEEYVAITKNGKRFPILVYANIVKNKDIISGIRGIIVNISDLKRVEQELKISEENFRQLSENITDAFWLRSLDNKLIYANPACQLIVGNQLQEIFEDFETYKNWIHPDDREKIVNQRNKNLLKPDQSHFYEHRIIKENAEVRWLWIRTFPVFDSKGKLYRRAGIASDITNQKKLLSELIEAKEKAEESDRLKSAFLANMSHEIRTPMNGILGFAQLLKDDDISEEERLDYLKVIDSNGKQLLSLIDDIVDVAKIEAGQLTISKSILKITPVLEEIYQFFYKQQKQLNKQNIKFSLEIPVNGNDTIFTDELRLKQIIHNLVNNAFKFTEKGEIKLGYSIIHIQKKAYYQFFVSDTGIGIHPDVHDLIFERFGQIEPKIQSNNQGTGLGLAISKGLCKLLGGEIWLESIPKNPSNQSGGSIFYFTIPMTQMHDTSKHKSEDHKRKHKMKNFENVHILVVEDDDDNLELLRRFIQKLGAHVLAARSGDEAIELVKANKHIKLVLMDIRLPDIDGFETTKQIKAINPNLPVIAQTAYAMYNDREECLEHGCDDYLSKPLDREILYQKINHYIYD